MLENSLKNERLERYLKTITNEAGDPTFSILKAHLLFEELLNEYITFCLPNPTALKGARLSFAQTLALVTALEAPGAELKWYWEALQKLNSLRNKLAHNVVLTDLQMQSQTLAKFITEKLEEPLTPSNICVINEAGNHTATYTMIDISMVGLYAFLHGKLDRAAERDKNLA